MRIVGTLFGLKISMIIREINMRCRACDCLLSDFESTRKDPITGEYEDLCSRCYEWDEGYMDEVWIEAEEESDE